MGEAGEEGVVVAVFPEVFQEVADGQVEAAPVEAGKNEHETKGIFRSP